MRAVWGFRLTATILAAALLPAGLAAQDRRDEQFYYPGSFNWTFLKTYPEGARLFNAFDYGHAVLYERLLTKPPAEREAALEKEYRFLTTDLLIRPPRFAVAEEVIEPEYAKLAWQAKQMFDWAHVLHRQIYDIYADERLDPAARDSLIERVTDYYLSRKDYAFTAAPKSMALMDEQSFSQGFRKAHPKFNGLIWAYHWLQVGLYEPLILGTTPAEKKAGVKATLARFWSMLEDAPEHFPSVMPMTSAVAPTFSAKHPRAAVIFDNLHMMHDIISDILIADTIPRNRKRAVIYQQLAEFRDGTRNVMSLDEWHHMAEMMGGVDLMGGPASGLLAPAPSGGAMPHEGMHAPAARSPKPDTAAHAHPAPPGAQAVPAAPEHRHEPEPGPAAPATGLVPAARGHEHRGAPPPLPSPMKSEVDSAAPEGDPTPVSADSTAQADVGPGGFPLHSGHPLVVHFPLAILLLAVVCDGVAAARKNAGWRGAATLLWWVGLAGAALAIGTGLLAYNRVEHSDLAHEAMVRHRNIALAAVGILAGAALWRWRRPFSAAAVTAGIVGALGLTAAGYLGGELVFRHGIGISTAGIGRVMDERGGHRHEPLEGMPPMADSMPEAGRESLPGPAKPHTHPSGEPHEP